MCLLYDVHVLMSAQRNINIINAIQQALPMFLLRLATDVDWMEEQPCFAGIATELRCVLKKHMYTIDTHHHISRAGAQMQHVVQHTVLYLCVCVYMFE
jgi:DNA mismatch repair protein Mlh1 C-terminus